MMKVVIFLYDIRLIRRIFVEFNGMSIIKCCMVLFFFG